MKDFCFWLGRFDGGLSFAELPLVEKWAHDRCEQIHSRFTGDPSYIYEEKKKKASEGLKVCLKFPLFQLVLLSIGRYFILVLYQEQKVKTSKTRDGDEERMYKQHFGK